MEYRQKTLGGLGARLLDAFVRYLQAQAAGDAAGTVVVDYQPTAQRARPSGPPDPRKAASSVTSQTTEGGALRRLLLSRGSR